MAKFETDENGNLRIDGKVIKRGWESLNGWYWFGVEVDHKQDSLFGDEVEIGDSIWFGFVQGIEEEWGYFSEAELKRLSPRVWEINKQDLPFAGRR